MELRPTTTADLDFVRAAESEPEAARFVTPGTREEHEEIMADPDQSHLIIAEGSRPLGFVLLYVAGIGVSTIGAGWALGLAYRFRDMRAAALMQMTLFGVRSNLSRTATSFCGSNVSSPMDAKVANGARMVRRFTGSQVRRYEPGPLTFYDVQV